jgi:hypothetical protein
LPVASIINTLISWHWHIEAGRPIDGNLGVIAGISEDVVLVLCRGRAEIGGELEKETVRVKRLPENRNGTSYLPEPTARRKEAARTSAYPHVRHSFTASQPSTKKKGNGMILYGYT